VLLKQIVLPAVVESEEYLALLDAVRVLEARLRGVDGTVLQPIKQLTDQLNGRLSTLIKAEVQIGMDPPDAEKFVGSNTTLRLGDGLPTRIELQGHGLQRALVFAMLELLASRMCAAEDNDGEAIPGRSVVLLFEEPELFIHPHLMRRLRDVLSTIAHNGRWQVVVTTHSPFLVNIGEDPTSLVIHRRSARDAPPTVKQLAEDPFADGTMRDQKERLNALLRFHPTVCEAFFAQRVVLVEGDSEMALLTCEPRLLEQVGVELDAAREITLVSCAGKWTIVPMARLLRLFDVPLRVMHDLDLKGRSPDEIESPLDPYKANAAIEAAVGDPTAIRKNIDALEHVLWEGANVPTSSDDKPIRALRRVRELCAADEHLDNAPVLKELVRFVFDW
jgi:predicted ATP-dependent endonuclease of OLD family